MAAAARSQAEEILSKVRPCLAGRPEIAFGYLFGSLARGEARPASDVDVAVFLDPPPSPESESGMYRATLLTELIGALGRNDVDLVILNQAPVVLRHRAIRDDLVICSRDERRRVAFVVDTVRRYVDTEPLRRLAREYLRRSIENGTYGREVKYKTAIDGLQPSNPAD